MRRGTTPTLQLTVSNEDGSPCDITQDEIYVTFVESGTEGQKFTKRETDPGVSMEVVGNATVVSITLTQNETLAFKARHKVSVQMRSKHGAKASATGIAKFKVEEILLDGEI